MGRCYRAKVTLQLESGVSNTHYLGTLIIEGVPLYAAMLKKQESAPKCIGIDYKVTAGFNTFLAYSSPLPFSFVFVGRRRGMAI